MDWKGNCMPGCWPEEGYVVPEYFMLDLMHCRMSRSWRGCVGLDWPRGWSMASCSIIIRFHIRKESTFSSIVKCSPARLGIFVRILAA